VSIAAVTGEATPLAKAKQPATDSGDSVLSCTEKNAMAASLVIALHQQLQLWRLCRKAGCRRARARRGDALRCAARRWKVAGSILAKAEARRVRGRAAQRLLRYSMRLWSEVNGALCEHKELLFTGMVKGPFLHIVRENPDGTKTVVFRQDLSEEQARKLQQEMKRWGD
jgi:hypothetical protein